MTEHSGTVSSGDYAPPNAAANLPAVTPTSQLERASHQPLVSGDTLLWTEQDAVPPNNHAAQPELSSSLLWPDSENLFLSLTDGALWDNSMPGLMSLDHLPHVVAQATAAPPVATGLSPYDEPTVTEDGRRAVQTTNGLLTNTVRETHSRCQQYTGLSLT